MNFARRIAEYDLMRAYVWWRGLPGLVRAVLFLPLAATPAVATLLVAAYFCTEVERGIVFVFLFAGLGQMATVFLVSVLPGIGRRAWAGLFIIVRFSFAKHLLFDHAASIETLYPHVAKYLAFIQAIEYVTLFSCLWITWRIHNLAKNEYFQINHVGTSTIRRTTSDKDRGPFPLLRLWNSIPEIIRWVYCWGIVFTPPVAMQHLISLTFIADTDYLWIFLEQSSLIFPALFLSLVFIPRKKWAIILSLLFFHAVNTSIFYYYVHIDSADAISRGLSDYVGKLKYLMLADFVNYSLVVYLYLKTRKATNPLPDLISHQQTLH